jgi:eukaryotic-like serine/threonine-protein kinase
VSVVSPTAQLVDGRYRLGEVLGTGGAAVVRRAHDERLGRDVAIKLFHPGTADEQRQSGELELMAALAHPALVRMYDGGRITDPNGAQSAYLVMEYVSGPTLQGALRAGAMNIADVAAIGAALTAALAYLHGQGVVHRDVKPANVLLPADDEVAAKLGDFGIARLLDGSRVTATGMTVGTANYLSPEQARGEPVGPPSDIYSLGLVLLEAATGRIAYGGVGVTAALARLNRPPVIPSTFGPAWTSLLAAMLDADPAARPDAAQVRRDLAAVETSAPADAGSEAAAATMAVSQAHGTVVLPAQSWPRRDEHWPESHLIVKPPRRRPRMRPAAALLLAGSAAAAIVVALLAASMSRGASDPPAAPRNPAASFSRSPSDAAPSHPAPAKTAVTHPNATAPASKATSVPKARKAPRVANPGAGPGKPATRNRPNPPAGPDPAKPGTHDGPKPPAGPGPGKPKGP